MLELRLSQLLRNVTWSTILAAAIAAHSAAEFVYMRTRFPIAARLAMIIMPRRGYSRLLITSCFLICCARCGGTSHSRLATLLSWMECAARSCVIYRPCNGQEERSLVLDPNHSVFGSNISFLRHRQGEVCHQRPSKGSFLGRSTPPDVLGRLDQLVMICRRFIGHSALRSWMLRLGLNVKASPDALDQVQARSLWLLSLSFCVPGSSDLRKTILGKVRRQVRST